MMLLESPEAKLRRAINEWLSPTSWNDVGTVDWPPCMCNMVALWWNCNRFGSHEAFGTKVVVRCPHGEDIYVHPDRQDALREYLYRRAP